jgi:hypothetical protein
MFTFPTKVRRVEIDGLRPDILKKLLTTLVLSNCEPDTTRKRLGTDLPT